MTIKSIDINCDVGEGIPNESKLYPYISSCNIACGGHTGSAQSMTEAMVLAKNNSVKIGAHPSYVDAENFGRISLNVSKTDFQESIYSQLFQFEQLAQKNNVVWHHVKPHGALYNDLAINQELAKQFLEILERFSENLAVYVPFGSSIYSIIKKTKRPYFLEAFADRRYYKDGTLVPRKEQGSVLTSSEEVFQQVKKLALKAKVTTNEGVEINLPNNTICVHGDTPNALQILMYISKNLPNFRLRLKK